MDNVTHLSGAYCHTDNIKKDDDGANDCNKLNYTALQNTFCNYPYAV